MPATYLYEAAIAEVLAVEPSVGVPAGGTAVVVLGRGFQVGATVTFDGVAATSVVVVSSERLTCTTPAHALGAVAVVVTNPDASTGTLAGGFTYETTAPATAVSYRTPAGAATRIRELNQSPQITQRLGQAATYSFTAAFEPVGESRVECRVFGVQLFLGTVTHKTERVDGAERLQAWDTTGTDLSHRLSRRRPTGSWIATSGTTVLNALMAGFAPGFSAVVEGGLDPVTLVLDGSADLWSALVDVCQRCGAKLVLLGTTLYVFTVDLGIDPPDAVTESNPDLIWIEGAPVTLEWDYTQIRNRVTVRGAEGITATLDDGASIALYGVTEFLIDDTTLTTPAELVARAQAELDAWALPIPIAHYATRDLRSTVGKSVVITIARPLIAGTFLITAVQIDQLELAVASPPTRPRFSVTARPAEASITSAGDQNTRLMASVVDLAAAANKAPRLSGDIVSEPGGRTTIPDGSVPATKLAGCIGSTLLTDTGVPPDDYGDGAHLVAFTVDAAGRITAAVTDPVPVIKTDGSQPYTADQSMGGNRITDGADPVDPQDFATMNYVDAEIAAIVPPTGVKGEVPTGAVNGDGTGAGNTVYTTAAAFGSTLAVYRNGVRQKLGEDYTETDVDEFTMVTAPLTGDLLLVDYHDAGGGGGGGGAAGALVLLESHTAAASATLDFTTRNAPGQSGATVQADFDEYVLEILGLVPATDSVTLHLRLSTDGGATYDAGTNYGWGVLLWRAGATGLFGAEGGATSINLTGDVSTNHASWGINGKLTLYDPGSTTRFKVVLGQTHFKYPTGSFRLGVNVHGSYEVATAVNALRVYVSSGNLASGTVRLYGVAK